MENISKNFSDALKMARGERSQAEMARFLGISSQATYQRYEAGRVPDGEVLHQIATKLGVKIESLLQNETRILPSERGKVDLEPPESQSPTLRNMRIGALFIRIRTYLDGLQHPQFPETDKLEAADEMAKLARELAELLKPENVEIDPYAAKTSARNTK